MITDTFAQMLEKHYLFAGLDKPTRKMVFQKAFVKKIPANSFIFQKNDTATNFYFISKGSVRLFFSSPDGKEKTVRVFQSGQSFAEAIMFMNRNTYPANAMTMTDTTLIAFNIKDYYQQVADNPKKLLAILGHFSTHIQNLSGQIEMLSVLDARNRVMLYLRQQAPPHIQDGESIAISQSKKNFAEFLAIRHETLSRLLRQLEDEGIVQWHQNHLVLLDVEKIRSFATN